MKKCNRCNISKHLSEFHKCKNKKDGYKSVCKLCIQISSAVYYMKNKLKIIDKVTQYQKTHPGKRKIWGINYRKCNSEKEIKRRCTYRENNREVLKEKGRVYKRNNREKVRKAGLKYYENDKEIIKEKNCNYYENNNIKFEAHGKVARAIRSGLLIRPEYCSVCYFINEDIRIEAHHSDYSKPLDVIWMCTSCHRIWHQNNKAVGG